MASTVVFNAGDIILGGDGSDLITGNAGDDIIDGDKWLDVQIGVFANDARRHTGTPIALHNSMTTLAASDVQRHDQPRPAGSSARSRRDTTAGDIDTARFQGNRCEYAFSATADGQVIVSHAVEDSLDGTDRLRNIERVQFADGDALEHHRRHARQRRRVNGTARTTSCSALAATTCSTAATATTSSSAAPTARRPRGDLCRQLQHAGFSNSTGATTGARLGWKPATTANSADRGQIRIDDGTNVLRFAMAAPTGNGARITRAVNLAGATTARSATTSRRWPRCRRDRDVLFARRRHELRSSTPSTIDGAPGPATTSR